MAKDKKNLSGLDWFKKNQAKFPNSNKVSDLAGSFRKNVESFIKALQKAGAKIDISSTLRNESRAHIMHYAWQLANGKIKAAKIPKKSGVNIEWDHGDEKQSQAAAKEMVGRKGFNMAHGASLTSHHIKGLAIDMTITWSGNLCIEDAKGNMVDISSTPKDGTNKELHPVGESYGVKKLVKDPPHWSHDGR